MVPDKLENCAQCCFNKFDCRFVIYKFIEIVLLVSFTLSHFKKSSPTLVQVLQPLS